MHLPAEAARYANCLEFYENKHGTTPNLADWRVLLSLTGHVAGDGFAIDLAVADVPEPRSAVLLAAGLAPVFGLAGRRAPLEKS